MALRSGRVPEAHSKMPQGLKPTFFELLRHDQGRALIQNRVFPKSCEVGALIRFVAGLEKAARCARIPGLKIETRASQVCFSSQAVKSCLGAVRGLVWRRRRAPARIPGLKIETRASQVCFSSQAVKSCPDAVCGWYGEGGARRANPGSQNRDPGQPGLFFFRKL